MTRTELLNLLWGLPENTLHFEMRVNGNGTDTWGPLSELYIDYENRRIVIHEELPQ